MNKHNSKILLFYILFLSVKGFSQTFTKGLLFKTISEFSNSKTVIDKYGNIYLAGEFAENPLKVDTKTYTTNGGTDIFIIKLDSTFNIVWSKIIGGAGMDHLSNIAIDGNDDLLLTAYFEQTISIEGNQHTSIGKSDFLICKINPKGKFVWANTGGSEFHEFVKGNQGSIVLDSNNNLYVCGTYADVGENDTTVVFQIGTFSVKSFGGGDIFVLKMNAAGEVFWIKRYGSYSSDWVKLFSNNTNYYLTGGSRGGFNYGTKLIVSPYFSTRGFTIKLDSNMQDVWTSACYLTEYGNLKIVDGVVDNKGNVFISGIFFPPSGNLRYANQSLYSNGAEDIFIAMLNKNGNLKWIKSLGGTSTDNVTKLTRLNDNHFIITGSLNGNVEFEGFLLNNAKGDNFFLLDLDSNGNSKSFKIYGNNGSSEGKDVIVAKNDDLIIIGELRTGELSFGSISFINMDKPSGLFVTNRKGPIIVSIIKKSITQFLLFPNPVKDNLNISPSKIGKEYILKIYNENGILIISNMFSESNSIDVSGYKPGCYIFEFVPIKDGKRIIQKVFVLE